VTSAGRRKAPPAAGNAHITPSDAKKARDMVAADIFGFDIMS
jgi:hypothetical protein